MSTIKIIGTPPNCVIEIDGRPTEVMSLDLHLDGNSLPKIVITPPVFDVDVYIEGDVELDEQTKRTLTELGWTPPCLNGSASSAESCSTETPLTHSAVLHTSQPQPHDATPRPTPPHAATAAPTGPTGPSS